MSSSLKMLLILILFKFSLTLATTGTYVFELLVEEDEITGLICPTHAVEKVKLGVVL
ncbi:hypothetical protein IKS57_00845 [bacterium]|nr:hypothetical protein [bacterium]